MRIMLITSYICDVTLWLCMLNTYVKLCVPKGKVAVSQLTNNHDTWIFLRKNYTRFECTQYAANLMWESISHAVCTGTGTGIYTHIYVHTYMHTHTYNPLEILRISRAIVRITWTEENAVRARRVSKMVLNEKGRERDKKGWRNRNGNRRKMYARIDHHSILNERQLVNAYLNTRSIAYTVIPWPQEYKF